MDEIRIKEDGAEIHYRFNKEGLPVGTGEGVPFHRLGQLGSPCWTILELLCSSAPLPMQSHTWTGRDSGGRLESVASAAGPNPGWRNTSPKATARAGSRGRETA